MASCGPGISLIQNSFCAMSPHSIIDVCVHGGLHCRRKAGGWRQQIDEIRAVRTVEQLLFSLSWSQKWGQKPAPKTGPKTGPKNGAAIFPEEGKASKMAALFLGPGCMLRNLSFVFLAMGLTKPHPSFTLYILYIYNYTK